MGSPPKAVHFRASLTSNSSQAPFGHAINGVICLSGIPPNDVNRAPPTLSTDTPADQFAADRRLSLGRRGALHPLHGDRESEYGIGVSGRFANMAVHHVPDIDCVL